MQHQTEFPQKATVYGNASNDCLIAAGLIKCALRHSAPNRTALVSNYIYIARDGNNYYFSAFGTTNFAESKIT